MANSDLPQGARPKGVPLRQNKYMAGGTVYPGDFVKFDNAGKVVVGAAGDALCGVANSYAVSGDDLIVFDHPDQLFVIQSDDGSVDAQTDINLNYNFTATAANTTYRISRQELDGSTGATDSNLPLKLLAIEDQVNNALGTNVDCVVKINNHQLGSSTGTTGV